jgi:lipopolysaccharide biosynthesis protein
MKHSHRLIAFYLPQFHRIPENDKWWGAGFTEWTNVKAAEPLFQGHLQPRYPTSLGYYDLTDFSAREAQAELAQHHGIEGFCYWHYWFGNGKKLLQRPLEEVAETGRPNFPFCVAWANESWTGIWHGLDSKVLQAQLYPGMQDARAHFFYLLPFFSDPRYIRVDD